MSLALLDDFGSGIGNWTVWGAANHALAITSGALTNDGVNFRCSSYYNVKQFGPDVEVTFTIPAFGSTANDEIDVQLRASTTDPATASVYSFIIANSVAGGIAINYTNAGTFVGTLASNGAFNSWTAGDTVGVQAIGSSLTMYRNGVSVLSATDSNITAAGWVAIEITNTAKTDSVDNLYGGNYYPPLWSFQPVPFVAPGRI